MTEDTVTVELHEDVALINARLIVYSVVHKDGTNGFIVRANGDAPMTTYLGLTVVAQREIQSWNDLE